jgi:outer membrane receptor for ferrienterochelin and colicins
MRVQVLIALLLWLGSAGASGAEEAAAPAGGQADEAQFHFLRGNRAYQERRFEDALASYYLSNRLVANRNVQFNIARCLERLGRYAEAYRAWSTLLDPSLPEHERKAAQDAVNELRPHLALLDISSSPPGATIYAGRRDLGALGVTPKSLALAPGPTKILLERDGYRAIELAAEPVLGTERKLTASLERIYGELEIRRVPAAAEIRRDFLDGELLRRGPGVIRVLPGPAVLFVSAPGFRSGRMMVNVLPDTRVPVDALLAPAEPPTGALVVRCNIPAALIRVDGKEAGFAPAVIDGVLSGPRRVEIVAEGRNPFVTTVEVKQSERSFVDGYLAHADPEVTAATKSAMASESAPASVTVITADEIAAFGYTSLVEALAAIRGAFVSNDRSYESVGFRGFSPPGDYTNRVLVLVDGHVTNDAVTGQGYVGHDFDVDLANVARIEIVRGPGSVLYGTGALFGVINVVTRGSAEGTHASLDTMAGTLGLESGRVTASHRSGEVELMVSAAAMSTDGDRRYVWPPELNGGVPITVYSGDGERAQHLDVVERTGPFSFRAGYNHRRKSMPTGAYDTEPLTGTFNDDHRAFAELRYDGVLAGLGVAARAAYDASWYHGHFLEIDPNISTEQTLRARWVTGELRVEIPVFWRQRLTLGGEIVRQLEMYTDQPLPGNPPIPQDLILSAFLVDDVRLSSRLHLNLGLRSDSYLRTSGTTVSPRVALVGRPYQAGNSKLFFGRSFRAPSPNELANGPGPSLQPETIWSVEIEHSHKVTDDVQLVAAVFANWLDHLLVLYDDPSNGTLFRNAPDRVRCLGAETEARWEPGGGTLVSLSITRQRVEELGPGGSSPFLNAPQLLVKARVLRPLAGPILRLGSEVVLDSGRPYRQTDQALAGIDYRTDDALLWNVSLSGTYRAYHLRYFAGVFNLLDVHDARTGFPTSVDYLPNLIPRYGRSVRAGLSLGF